MRVRQFHRKRIPSSWEVREEGGANFGQRVRPLERVGIYVPGGKAAYPSSVIMNAVPASVVEVPEVVMATPAGKDGRLRPDVLMAARVAGVHRIFKMGGAHAVAALAYGTESVPRVDKIVGPGNVYVAAAKRLVFGCS
jgi:histidinol dehydrogenase